MELWKIVLLSFLLFLVIIFISYLCFKIKVNDKEECELEENNKDIICNYIPFCDFD